MWTVVKLFRRGHFVVKIDADPNPFEACQHTKPSSRLGTKFSSGTIWECHCGQLWRFLKWSALGPRNAYSEPFDQWEKI